MITAGIDIGSVATKVLILEDKKVLSQVVCPTGPDLKAVAQEMLKKALAMANLSSTDIKYIVSTGYGRRTIEFGDRTVTEISACARAAQWMSSSGYLPEGSGQVRTIIDLGGQDTKVISLEENGDIADFVMNDKCAAGTGRFLEVIFQALQVKLDDLEKLSINPTNFIRINSTCTVFAESEVISLIAQGKKKEDIIAGIHYSVAERIVGMVKQVGERESILFVGGGAKNKWIHQALEDKLGKKVYLPLEPQFVIALGAALIAKDALSP